MYGGGVIYMKNEAEVKNAFKCYIFNIKPLNYVDELLNGIFSQRIGSKSYGEFWV